MEGAPESEPRRWVAPIAVGYCVACWTVAALAAAILTATVARWEHVPPCLTDWLPCDRLGVWLVLGSTAVAASWLALRSLRFIQGVRVSVKALLLPALSPTVAGAIGSLVRWMGAFGIVWMTDATSVERPGILASELRNATVPLGAGFAAAGLLMTLILLLGFLGGLVVRPRRDGQRPRGARGAHAVLMVAAASTATLLLGCAGVELFRAHGLGLIQGLRPEDRFDEVVKLLSGLRVRWAIVLLCTLGAVGLSAASLRVRPSVVREALAGRRRAAVALTLLVLAALAAPHGARALLEGRLRRAAWPGRQVTSLPGLELPSSTSHSVSGVMDGGRILVMTRERAFYLGSDMGLDLVTAECTWPLPQLSLAVDRRVTFSALIAQLRPEFERYVREHEFVTRPQPSRDFAELGSYAALGGPELSGTHVALVPDLQVALRGEYRERGTCSCRHGFGLPKPTDDEPKPGANLLVLLDGDRGRTLLWPDVGQVSTVSLELDRETVVARAERLSALRAQAPAMCRLVVVPRPEDSIERVLAAVEAFRTGPFREVVVTPARQPAEALASQPASPARPTEPAPAHK